MTDYKSPPGGDACRVIKAQIFVVVEAITLLGDTRTRCAVHNPEGELMAFVDADEHEAVTKGLQFLAVYLSGRMQWPSSDAVRMLLEASERPCRPVSVACMKKQPKCSDFATMIANRNDWTDARLEELRIAFELDVATMHRTRQGDIEFGRERIEAIATEQKRRRTDA